MPAKNPRLSVVLSPALAATLAALSAETGESASSLVRGVLDQAAPAFDRMLGLVKAAKSAKGQIGGGVADALDRVVNDLEQAVAIADERSRQAVSDLVTQAEAVKGRRRPHGGAGSARQGGRVSAGLTTPVPVTRGSGPLSTSKSSGLKGGKRGRV